MDKVLSRFVTLTQGLVSTTKRLEKEAILAKFDGDEDIRFVLWFLYNPYIVTGVSEKKVRRQALPLLDGLMGKEDANAKKSVSGPASLRELLEYFQKNNTGRDADLRVLHEFATGFNEVEREIIYGLVRKDLKLGVQEKTLNKVFGEGFIPTMNVMLAESYWENQAFLKGKEFIVTLKVDGVRAILMFQEGTPVFFTRNGRVLEGLVELSEAVMKLDRKYVYDGELILESARSGNSADLYRATVKVTASDDEKRGLSFNMFDRVLREDFLAGSSLQPAVERKSQLAEELKIVGNPLLVPVPILYKGSDLGQIDVLLDKYVDEGEEGIMINPADSPYECKRTKNLLKVKKFHTADVLVLSVEEGTGANRGKLGAVIVKFHGPDGKEYTCRVGSGFSKDQREEFWANPSLIKGKIIEIGYFELSRNQDNEDYSLRFPTFKHVRDDKSEISMH